MITCPKKLKCAYDFVKNIYDKYVPFMENYVSSLLLISIRISIGLVFFKSGLTKIANFDQTIILFTYEYALPVIPPQLAAISGTAVELGCGALVIAGLMTRIFVIPLIVMTCVIQFLVFQNPEHFYWLSMLATLAIYGGGKLSVDGVWNYYFAKK